ncbi:hypothetical protein CRUP_027307 [Coryphaenoides rupestris]|nr:hypothetical protein CRUP_027307 [Coryphaenoides rupestris]
MVAVQVERDPRTGATVVRSVAPISAPGAATGAMTTTVFDDGRKSVHAIGGGGAQPSAEELGRILNAIDGVGMTVLLDDVAMTATMAAGLEVAPDGERAGESRSAAASVNGTHRVIEVSSETGLGEGPAVAMTGGLVEPGVPLREGVGQPDATEAAAVADSETPVTLTFLGYADTDQQEAPEGVALGRDDHGGVLTVERVVIEEEEEEEVLEVPELRTDNGGPVGPVGAPEADGAFQEIQLGGSTMRLQAPGEEAQGPGDPDTPRGREHVTDTPSKPKACQCCSVM